MFENDWKQRLAGTKVLVTGHTGFTGCWARCWLEKLGAEVVGLALPPETTPSLHEAIHGRGLDASECVDIRNRAHVLDRVRSTAPELVLHLAAQPLVRKSYAEPLATFDTNVMGTLNVLSAARETPNVRGILCITTDKVYENRNRGDVFSESDRLGGNDPYSASKAASEIGIASWRKSYSDRENGPAIAVARGGNIIGGGDWSDDRLIPDYVRAVVNGETLAIRSPGSVRPWQHVMALLEGYLRILSALRDGKHYASQAFNFGPRLEDHLTVREVIDLFAEHWSRPAISFSDAGPPESRILRISSEKAKEVLAWRPVWNAREAIFHTAHWFREFHEKGASAEELCLAQIRQWESANREIQGG